MTTTLLPAFLGALLGGVLASFVNVIISRGPRSWGLVDARGPKGLTGPRSQCEGCGRTLRPSELIPIVSFLRTRGRCAACGEAIGWRHLAVELLGTVLGCAVVLRFGLTLEALFGAWLVFSLLALAFIDLETGYLPDRLTLPLIGVGLFSSFLTAAPPAIESVLGAVIGGGGAFLLAFGYRAWRGREGLGGGDVKLIAAGGAWCGAYALPLILLASSLAGLAAAGVMMLLGQRPAAMTAAIRFGPYLAASIAGIYLAGGTALIGR
jgi:leader peptidase (prepilin peptidase)/N-methyltransferase